MREILVDQRKINSPPDSKELPSLSPLPHKVIYAEDGTTS